MTEMEIAHNSRTMACQRIFIQGAGSNYMWVHSPSAEDKPESPTPIPPGRAYQQHIQGLIQEERKKRQTVVQMGDIDEATSWLNRTGWVRYLQGIAVTPLVQSIERPDEEAEADEGTALAIWHAMDRLARISQRVAKADGF